MYDPPTALVADPVAQWVITAIQMAAAIIVTIVAVRKQRGRELLLRILILVGGGLCVFFEPFGDRIGMIWHAAVGQWTLLHMYGHYVPVWMLGSYYWFCGGQTLYAVLRIRDGAKSAEMWRLYWIFLLMDGVLELPVLYVTDIYTYFGNQPFWWPPYVPLPLWYLVLNALIPIAAARAVLYVLSYRKEPVLWLIPVVIPMSLFAMYAATAWPTWAALNSSASTPVIYACGGLTIALGLLCAHLLTTVNSDSRSS